MSGKQKGVQARIQAIVARAIYTNCKAYWLNLAIIHASDSMHAKHMLATVLTIAFDFDFSAKRLLRSYENLETDAAGTEEMGRRTKLAMSSRSSLHASIDSNSGRVFCTMRRVKTYHRNTMGTERVSGFALLNIHQEREIDLEEVVDVFARRKERRLALLFRVYCNACNTGDVALIRMYTGYLYCF
ncbi:hypothetical protein DPMN_183618 [Dreissena polymorpha]|uniref:Uncharacterized protein n=1 Tax=Dreissena polymorpha TaxID=45954 RepID=A0A9D4I756_DREPO|nr:hypothetical protein DPMN_183618 [Dreissena polymorpha]